MWSGGDVNFGGNLVNQGTMTFTSNGDALANGAAAITNAAGATMIHDAEVVGNDHKLLRGNRIFNNGTIEVRQGRLEVHAGGTHSGEFVVRSDAEILFNSLQEFTDTAMISSFGTGTITFGGASEVDATIAAEGPVYVLANQVEFNQDVTFPELFIGNETQVGSVAGSGTVIVAERLHFHNGHIRTTVVNEGIATLDSLDVNQHPLAVDATFINRGQATLSDAGFLLGGRIKNEASGPGGVPVFHMTNDTTSNLGFGGSGTFENHGTWIVDSPSGGAVPSNQSNVTVENYGEFTIDGADIVYREIRQNAGRLILDDTTVEVRFGLGLSGGSIEGDATLIGDVTQSGGTISPGQSPGILTIDGEYNASAGELIVEIAGPPQTPGVDYDQLVITGNATVADLNVALVGGFTPTLGATYTVLTAQSINGPANTNAGDVGMTVHSNPQSLDLEVTTAIDPNARSISGQKFHDIDGDGERDADEPGLDGWTIELVDPTTGNVVATTTTESVDLDDNGSIDPLTERGLYTFGDLDPGDYVVREVSQPGWFQTSPNAPQFGEPDTYDIGSVTTNIVSAHLNEDRYADLVLINGSSHEISVLLNQGDGSFAPNISYAVGSEPNSVTTLDVNSDGYTDLAVANGGSDTVSILLNDGTGSFSPSATYDVGDGPRSIVTGDFNADSHMDLAIVNAGALSRDVSVLLNDGTGIFEEIPRIVPSRSPQTLLSADLDGDGDLDLGVGGNRLIVLANDGAANFTEAASNLPFRSGGSMTVGDLDGDGDLDIAGVNASSRLDVTLNNGDGTFADATSYLAGDSGFIASGDLDADGDLDLIAGDFDDGVVQVFLNDGLGGFAERVDFPVEDSPLSGTVTDVDGDGRQDIAVTLANDTVVVLRNLRRHAVTLTDNETISGIDFGNVELAQVVTPTETNPTPPEGTTFQVALDYSTTDNNGSLLGLGLRMHYDSSHLSFQSVDEVFDPGLVVQQVLADTADYDNDPATDRFVLLAWSDPDGNWPGLPLPKALVTASFTLTETAVAGTTSTINVTAASTAPTYALRTEPIVVGVIAASLDIDNNGVADALTDGTLIRRYLEGQRGFDLVQGAVAPDAVRTSADEITQYLDSLRSRMLDADGNCVAEPNDGAIIQNYLFGTRGAALIDGTLAADATRTNPIDIAAFLDGFHPDPPPTQAVTGISGMTFSDANRNGIRDIGESPLAGYTVRVVTVVDGVNEEGPSTISDANGYYVLELPPGRHFVGAILPPIKTTPDLNETLNEGDWLAGRDFGTGFGTPGIIGTPAENNPPVLDTSGLFSLERIAPDAADNNGTSVADLIASAGPPDRISDPDIGALEGIAITETDGGNWQYSTDGGTTWFNVGSLVSFEIGLGITPVVLTLEATPTTRVRLVPDGSTTTNQFRFRAWDRTEGANGNKSLPIVIGDSLSDDEATATIFVTDTDVEANRRPVLDTSNPFFVEQDIGTSVQELLTNPVDAVTDPDASASEGIAVTRVVFPRYRQQNFLTGTTTTRSLGGWAYSTDGGSTWSDLFDCEADDTTCTDPEGRLRLLAANENTRIRYVGEDVSVGTTDVASASITGTPSIEFHAWDQVVGTNSTLVRPEPLQLANSLSRITGQATVKSSLHAPVLDTSEALALDRIFPNDSDNEGTSISDLLASVPAFDPISDQDDFAIEGIAVALVDDENGQWEYSLDDGATWSAIGSLGLPGSRSALLRLLAADTQTRLRFVPDTGFTGEAGISFRAWDQTDGANGSLVQTLSATSGTSVSAEVGNAAVEVQNNRPVLDAGGDIMLSPIALDETDNNGTSVADLLASVSPLDAITNVDGTLEGIAIRELDESNGVWQYSLSQGSTWQDIGPLEGFVRRLLASNGPFTRIRFVPNPGFVGTASFSFRAWDQELGFNGGTTESFSGFTFRTLSEEEETAMIEVLGTPNDTDGVRNSVEAGAPNNGDGNNDGIADSRQNNVTSLPNAVTGQYITLVAPEGTGLVDVESVAPSARQPLPPRVSAPLGIVHFSADVEDGGSLTVDLLVPRGTNVNSFYKFGPRIDGPATRVDESIPAYYPFHLDASGTGAEFLDLNGDGTNDIRLHLIDGGRGDADLRANGIIVDPGVPVFRPEPIVAVGSDSGQQPRVRVFDVETGLEKWDFLAYDPGFAGGVRVATGDINGDGVLDIVTAAGPGGGPHIRIFDGRDLSIIHEFFAYDAGFRGGVHLAVGDVNGDGLDDIITGAGAGGTSHVRIFGGGGVGTLGEFFAYHAGFAGGVTVTVGDINGDGLADIITGAGPGGSPHVKVIDAHFLNARDETGQILDSVLLANFFAYDAAFAGGVDVAASDVTGDGLADVVLGAGPNGGPHVKLVDGSRIHQRQADGILDDSALLANFFAYEPIGPSGGGTLQTYSGGVRVALTDTTGDAGAELVTSPVLGGIVPVSVRDAQTLAEVDSLFAIPGFAEGVFIA